MNCRASDDLGFSFMSLLSWISSNTNMDESHSHDITDSMGRTYKVPVAMVKKVITRIHLSHHSCNQISGACGRAHRTLDHHNSCGDGYSIDSITHRTRGGVLHSIIDTQKLESERAQASGSADAYMDPPTSPPVQPLNTKKVKTNNKRRRKMKKPQQQRPPKELVWF